MNRQTITVPDFGVCLSVLDQAGGTGQASLPPSLPHPDDSWVTAQAFLRWMGYAPGEGASADAEAPCRPILKVAARLDRVFTLPLGRSPGVRFFGAQGRPSAFGAVGGPETGVNAAGRGLTPRQAFESCIGEAVEHLSMAEWPEDSERERRSGRLPADAVADPAWCASALGMDDAGLSDTTEWIRGAAIGGGDPAWFPVDLCLRRSKEHRPARAAESNGCAAGPSVDQATRSALGEVIERDAIALWWYGGASAAAIPQGYLGETGIAELLGEIRPATRRAVWLLSLPGLAGVPVVAALSAEPDGRAVVAGFAAGPDPVAAMRRAVLEMCQMELAQDLAVLRAREEGAAALVPQERIWLDRWRHLSVETYPRLRGAEEAAPPACGDLLEALAQAGRTAYRVDLTRPALGIPVVRVLVPGLQSASRDRITARLRAAAEQNGVNLQSRLHEYSPI